MLTEKKEVENTGQWISNRAKSQSWKKTEVMWSREGWEGEKLWTEKWIPLPLRPDTDRNKSINTDAESQTVTHKKATLKAEGRYFQGSLKLKHFS